MKAAIATFAVYLLAYGAAQSFGPVDFRAVVVVFLLGTAVGFATGLGAFRDE